MTCGHFDRVWMMCVARVCPCAIFILPLDAWMNWMDLLIFSSFFFPMRGSFSSSPVCILAFREVRSVTFACFQNRLMVFGPSPEMGSRSRSPLGMALVSWWSWSIFPVSKNSAIFSALAFPMPWILASSVALGPMVETSCVMDSSVRATRAFAFILKADSSRMVRMSAMRLKICASCVLWLAMVFPI